MYTKELGCLGALFVLVYSSCLPVLCFSWAHWRKAPVQDTPLHAGNSTDVWIGVPRAFPMISPLNLVRVLLLCRSYPSREHLETFRGERERERERERGRTETERALAGHLHLLDRCPVEVSRVSRGRSGQSM